MALLLVKTKPIDILRFEKCYYFVVWVQLADEKALSPLQVESVASMYTEAMLVEYAGPYKSSNSTHAVMWGIGTSTCYRGCYKYPRIVTPKVTPQKPTLSYR